MVPMKRAGRPEEVADLISFSPPIAPLIFPGKSFRSTVRWA